MHLFARRGLTPPVAWNPSRFLCFITPKLITEQIFGFSVLACRWERRLGLQWNPPVLATSLSTMRWHHEGTSSCRGCSPAMSPSRGAKGPPHPLRRTLTSHASQEQVASTRNAIHPYFQWKTTFLLLTSITTFTYYYYLLLLLTSINFLLMWCSLKNIDNFVQEK